MDVPAAAPQNNAEPPAGMEVHAVLGDQHWPLKCILLAVWAAVSFGAAFFARDLAFVVAGWPFGYWLAAQGAVLVFLAIVVIHAWAMNRLERKAATSTAHAAPDAGAAQDG